MQRRRLLQAQGTAWAKALRWEMWQDTLWGLMGLGEGFFLEATPFMVGKSLGDYLVKCPT